MLLPSASVLHYHSPTAEEIGTREHYFYPLYSVILNGSIFHHPNIDQLISLFQVAVTLEPLTRKPGTKP